MILVLIALARDYTRYWGKALVTLLSFVLGLSLFLVVELFINVLDQAISQETGPSYTHRLIHENARISPHLVQKIITNTVINDWIPLESSRDVWQTDQTNYSVEIAAINMDRINLYISPLLSAKQKKQLSDYDRSDAQNTINRSSILFFLPSPLKEPYQARVYSQFVQQDLQINIIPIPEKRQALAVMDIAYYQALYAKDGMLSSLGVNLSKQQALEAKKQLLDLDKGLTLQNKETYQASKKSWLSSLIYNLRFLAFISLIVSISLCMQCFHFIHHQRKDLYQNLVRAGLNPPRLLTMKLIELSIICILSSILAILLALSIVYLGLDTFNFFIQRFYFFIDASQVNVSGLLIVKAFLLAFTACLLSFFSIKKPLHTRMALFAVLISISFLILFIYQLFQVVSTLSGFLLTVGCLIGFFIICLFIPIIVARWLSGTRSPYLFYIRLAADSLKKYWHNSGVMLFVLALSIGLILSMMFYVHSFKSSLIKWLDISLSQQYYIQHKSTDLQFNVPIHKQALHDLSLLFGQNQVHTISRFSLNYKNYPLLINGLSSPESATFFEKVTAKTSSPRDIYISESFAIKHQLGIDQKITLPAISDQPFRIGKIIYDYVSEFGYIYLPQHFLNFSQEIPIHGISIGHQKQAHSKAFINQQLALISNQYQLNISKNDDLKRESLAIFNETFSFTWLLIALTSLLCFFSLITMITLICAQRQVELHHLWRLGVNQKSLHHMLLSHVRLLVFISSVLAILMGHLLLICIILGIQQPSFSWTIFIHIPFLHILISLLIYILVAEITVRATVGRLSKHFINANHQMRLD